MASEEQQDDINLKHTEGITEVRTRVHNLANVVQAHGTQIRVIEVELGRIDTKVGQLVQEVKQIRNALYLMATAIAANVPQMQALLDKLAEILK